MFQRRLGITATLGSLFLLAVVVRLFSMQVLDADHWREEAARLGRRVIRLPARRGRILDRHGAVLAEDRLQMDLTLRLDHAEEKQVRCARCGRPVWTPPGRAPSRCRTCGGRRFLPGTAPDSSSLPGLLGLSPEGFRAAVKTVHDRFRKEVDAEVDRRMRRYHRVRRSDVVRVLLRRERLLVPDAPPAAVKAVLLEPDRYHGFGVRPTYRRVRPEARALAGILGRVGPVFREEVDRYRRAGRSWSEIWRMRVGRSGLERAFERRLAARDGYRLVERDRRGRVKEVLEERPPEDGETIRLSLDLALQRRMTEALRTACRRHGAKGGAFAALDPESGEVLVLASWPPLGRDHPFLAVSSAVPGSVYKPVTAVIALESGRIDPGERFYCGPERWHGIGCHGSHGRVDLPEALSVSCNKYFARAAETIGLDAFVRGSRMLGFGARTGLPVTGEEAGLVPDDAWKARMHRRRPEYWRSPRIQPGELRQMGFGKGPLLVTPIQVARFMAILGNGGRFVTPTLLPGKGGPGARVVPEAVLGPVREGLRDVVERGTARRTGLARYRVDGKTGTAEIRAGGKRNMAWFAGFSPRESPRIAFACLLRETPSYGADAAGEVVAEFLEEYGKR